MPKTVIIFALLLATIVVPFLLRPKENADIAAGKGAERLVIITPHNESIMAEFSKGFTRHMKKNFNREIYIDWRQPGGTTEIAMFLKSEFANAFENYWKKQTQLPFDGAVREAFTDKNLDDTIFDDSRGYNARLKRVQSGIKEGTIDDLRLLSREMFLRSDAGIGIDLFFGGGAYDFSKQASAGALVATDRSGKFGPAILAKEHPDWFGDRVMPAVVSGEPFRDKDFRWVGTVLSSFGLCYNQDVIKRLGLDAPRQWDDLTDPRYIGKIALADPTKSGSATKAYEMLIQQKIQQVLGEMETQTRDVSAIEEDAIREGWMKRCG